MDGASNRTITDTGYYRVWLAAGGTGTETAPYELLAKLETALGARYMVRLTSEGLVRISYSGTGTSTLTWTGGANTAGALRSLLGFSGATTTISAGSYTDSTYQPHGCVFSAAVLRSPGIQTIAGGTALGTTESGEVYGSFSETYIARKSLTLGWHPRAWSDRLAETDSPTPLFPSSIDYVRTPRTLYGSTNSGSWSVHEFISQAATKRIAVLFATYQSKIASAVSASDFWTAHIAAESIAAARAERQPMDGWSRYEERDLDLNLLTGAL